MEGKV
jgi:hypothetical protein